MAQKSKMGMSLKRAEQIVLGVGISALIIVEGYNIHNRRIEAATVRTTAEQNKGIEDAMNKAKGEQFFRINPSDLPKYEELCRALNGELTQNSELKDFVRCDPKLGTGDDRKEQETQKWLDDGYVIVDKSKIDDAARTCTKDHGVPRLPKWNGNLWFFKCDKQQIPEPAPPKPKVDPPKQKIRSPGIQFARN